MKKTFKLISLGFILTLASCNEQGSSILASLSSLSVPSSELSSSFSSESSLEDYILTERTQAKYEQKTLHKYICPSKGDVKILVIPIALSGEVPYEWNETNLNALNAAFNKTEDFTYNCMETYFEQASFNKLHLTATITDVYHTSYVVNDFYGVSSEQGYTKAGVLFDEAFENAKKTYDMTQFDSDKDGVVDSVFFVVNGKYDDKDKSSAFYPHVIYSENVTGNIEDPNYNAYCASALSETISSLDETFIHEQGHCLGLKDYYNSNSQKGMLDYIGGMDMQSIGCFDWNSYSKMSVDWTDPYYFDGSKDEVTIKIKPAATYGDCILLAKNWNHTVFDEYVLIELFSPYGNNKNDWNRWFTDLGDQGGIRVYHVDGRAFGNSTSLSKGDFVDDIMNSEYDNLILACSNSYSSGSTFYSPYIARNYHLIHNIQKGKVNTFGTPGSGNFHFKKDDFFITGDSFSMADYGENFFYKKTTFDNGDEFPYKVDFINVTSDEATVKISLI